jgi:hypothetical protein
VKRKSTNFTSFSLTIFSTSATVVAIELSQGLDRNEKR